VPGDHFEAGFARAALTNAFRVRFAFRSSCWMQRQFESASFHRASFGFLGHRLESGSSVRPATVSTVF
jgi:hypothetical protein